MTPAFYHFEERLLNESTSCTLAIKAHYQWLGGRFPEIKNKLHWHPNGYVPEMLEDRLRAKRHHLKMVTVGVISDEGVYFVRDLLKTLKDSNIAIRFSHYGKPPNVQIENEYSSVLKICGTVSHREAVSRVSNADFLLVCSSTARAATMLLSSKLFEYLATGVPIIVVRPTVPDEEFLSSLPWVLTMDCPDVKRAAEFIRRCIEENIHADTQWLCSYRAQYNRRTQTQKLAKLLNEIS